MDKLQTLREKDNPSNNVYPNILTGNIPNKGVTRAKIDDNAIDTQQLATQSVTEAKIFDNAVSTDKIQDNAVTTGKIANAAITQNKLGLNAVGTYNIEASAVTNAKIANNSVTFIKAKKTINTLDVYLGSITTLDQLKSALLDFLQESYIIKMFQGVQDTYYLDFSISVDLTRGEVYYLQGDGNSGVIDSDADAVDFMENIANEVYIVLWDY